MAPSRSPPSRAAHLGRVTPVVGRTGVDLLLRADEGAVLHPGHVARIGVGPVAVGPLGLGELGERAGVDQQLAEAVVLVGRAVAPFDPVGLGDRRDLVDPGEEFGVRGRGHLGWLYSLAQPVGPASNARHVPWVPPNLGARPVWLKTRSWSVSARRSEVESSCPGCATTRRWSTCPVGAPWSSPSTAWWRGSTSTWSSAALVTWAGRRSWGPSATWPRWGRAPSGRWWRCVCPPLGGDGRAGARCHGGRGRGLAAERVPGGGG